MRALQARSLVLTVVLAGMALCAGCAGAQVQPAPAKPKPGPPPGVPTEFGLLVRVERQPSTTIRVIAGRGGGRDEIQKAAEGKEFLILHFEGTAKLDLIESGAEKEDPIAILVESAGRAAVRSEYRSTLTDGAGNKLDKAYFVGTRLQRQLAFEIPQGASGLIWSDGKASFRLEPKILRIEAPQTPPAQ